MKIRPVHGLSVALAIILVGCTSPREAFYNQDTRPTEQCLPSAVNDQVHDHDQLFGDNFPMQYVVKKGDTLWDISKRFLVKPWYWKQVWYNNPQIRNPHLIYPGDVLSVVAINGQKHIAITDSSNDYHGISTGKSANGLPVVKYSPHTRTESLADGPITISHSIIEPHLMKTQIFAPEAIPGLPFIYGDANEYVTLSGQQEIFAKGLLNLDAKYFDIYRVGSPIYDTSMDGETPYEDSGVTAIGYEMDYIGKAGLVKHDPVQDLSVLMPIEVVRDMREGDVIVPASDEGALLQYFPQLPSSQCQRGYIINNTTDFSLVVKEFDTIVTGFGADNGAKPGDIWKVARPGVMRTINGQVLKTPYKEVGYIMIYRVYPDVSLAFVLDSTQPIYRTDHLIRP